jgi:hypothetical protein
MLQEENGNILEKVQLFWFFFQTSNEATYGTIKPVFIVQLRLEEERCKEADARVKELEKQVLISFHIFKHVLKPQHIGILLLDLHIA